MLLSKAISRLTRACKSNEGHPHRSPDVTRTATGRSSLCSNESCFGRVADISPVVHSVVKRSASDRRRGETAWGDVGLRRIWKFNVIIRRTPADQVGRCGPAPTIIPKMPSDSNPSDKGRQFRKPWCMFDVDLAKRLTGALIVGAGIGAFLLSLQRMGLLFPLP